MPEATHRYEKGERFDGIVVRFLGTGIRGLREITLEPGQVFYVPISRLGDWRRPEGDGTPPYLVAEDGGLAIRPNGARVIGYEGPLAEPFRLEHGESVRLGDAMLTAVGVIRSTVAVRNAFGYQTTTHADVQLAEGVAGARTARARPPEAGHAALGRPRQGGVL